MDDLKDISGVSNPLNSSHLSSRKTSNFFPPSNSTNNSSPLLGNFLSAPITPILNKSSKSNSIATFNDFEFNQSPDLNVSIWNTNFSLSNFTQSAKLPDLPRFDDFNDGFSGPKSNRSSSIAPNTAVFIPPLVNGSGGSAGPGIPAGSGSRGHLGHGPGPNPGSIPASAISVPTYSNPVPGHLSAPGSVSGISTSVPRGQINYNLKSKSLSQPLTQYENYHYKPSYGNSFNGSGSYASFGSLNTSINSSTTGSISETNEPINEYYSDPETDLDSLILLQSSIIQDMDLDDTEKETEEIEEKEISQNDKREINDNNGNPVLVKFYKCELLNDSPQLSIQKFHETFSSTFYKRNNNGYMFIRETNDDLIKIDDMTLNLTINMGNVNNVLSVNTNNLRDFELINDFKFVKKKIVRRCH